MIFSDATYNGITLSRFVRGSGFQAEAIPSDRITIRSTRDPLPAQPGIQRYLDEYGSRLMEIRGWIKGTSESDLYDKEKSLSAAFDIKNLESSYAATFGFAPFDWTDPGQSASRYYLKPLQNTLNIQENRTGLSRGFSVLMEARDPTRYSQTSTAYTITVSSIGTGGSGFPVSFPILFSAAYGTAQTTVTNSGSVEVYPDSIYLYGPPSGTWTAPSVTNTTSGDAIVFTSDVTLTTGQYVVINPRLATAQKYNGSSLVDVSAYIISSSIFWTVAPGNSIVTISGSSTPVSSYAVITIISSY